MGDCNFMPWINVLFPQPFNVKREIWKLKWKWYASNQRDNLEQTFLNYLDRKSTVKGLKICWIFLFISW